MTPTPALGRAVLAADELLCSPYSAQLAEWLRSTIPVQDLDQLTAAADQVLTGLATAAAAGVVEGTVALPPGEHPDWIRLGALTALGTWIAARGATCQHSPHPARPQPIVAAAWRPDLMTCAGCTHLLRLPRRSAADRTCDACGRVCAGTGDDLVYPGALIVGPLQYLAGACGRCRYWPDPATERTTMRDNDRDRRGDARCLKIVR